MLVLKNITKEYHVADTTVQALRGVSIGFRKSELVSVLGQSGCGKTTLLNIIGGLDRYTSGELLINGRSTKSFRDADWDAYRNHSIGFVFQSYNLIPHQSVLTNVELALTISGVSGAERRERAENALKRVGLGDQIHKMPNQLSGGQMQRVAIARAIVNDPEILLADEPTGALDSATSLQIMEILREIASDRLVIMVTHNPTLAEEYSTRIIRLQDGLVIGDSDPYDMEQAAVAIERPQKRKKALSMKTALSLSLNNLMTKKARTFLTSFAGSIGIIGIALILSLSAGIKAYINDVQEDTLSSYPITLQKETQNYSALFSAMMDAHSDAERPAEDGVIYVSDSMVNMLSAMMSTTTNDLASFKAYLEEHRDELGDAVTEISYTYAFNMQIYSADGKTRVSPSTLIDNMGDSIANMVGMMSSSSSLYSSHVNDTMNVFREMLDNTALLQSQYDVIAGKWSAGPHELMLVVNENNALSNMALYALGIEDQSELAEIIASALSGKKPDLQYKDYHYEDFVGMKFYVVPNSDFYVKTGETYEVDGVEYPIWADVRKQSGFDADSFSKEHGIEISISAIIRPNPDAVASSLTTGTVAYDGALEDELMETVRQSEVARQLTEQTPGYDIMTGLPYDDGRYDHLTNEEKISLFSTWITDQPRVKADIMLALLSDTRELAKAQVAAMSDEERVLYAATHFYELATLDPDALKPMLLELLEMSLGEEYSNYRDYFESMDAKTLLESIGSSGNFDPTQQTEETLQAISAAFLQLPPEQQLSIVETLVAYSLQGDAAEKVLEQYTTAQLTELFDEQFPDMTAEDVLALYDRYMPSLVSESSYDDRTYELGFVDPSSPMTISIYSKDFESKDLVSDFIADYNRSVGEEKEISYTDLVGLMMSSITTIIDSISYVLVAFVSISLVVSSIMIGIITYISVLERTKEIGILRAIGASKRDISRVFNAETLIVGFCAGAIGILATALLCLPINAIIHVLSGISTINASLPPVAAGILLLISMVLTLVAGSYPSRLAAKKDPVLALRSE